MQQDQPIIEAEAVDQEFATTRNQMREAVIQAVSVSSQDLGLVSESENPEADMVEEAVPPMEEEAVGEADQQSEPAEEAPQKRPTKKYKPIKLNRAQRRFRAHHDRAKRRKEAREQAPVWPVPVETLSARCPFCHLPYVGPTSARCQHPAMPPRATLERIRAHLLALQTEEAEAGNPVPVPVSPVEVAA